MMAATVASAPGKVILFGEHGVNRGHSAVATGIDCRAWCRVVPRPDTMIRLHSSGHADEQRRDAVLAYKQEIDALRAAGKLDELRARSRGDFFAPARYVLGHVLEAGRAEGFDIWWWSELPIGSGLGSGAAAAAALARAVAHHERDEPIAAAAVARLAWQGDVIAHGGIASGLDSGACAFGGTIRYSVARGPTALPLGPGLPLVIGDTGIVANTAEVNTRVQSWFTADLGRAAVFGEIGAIVDEAIDVLARGELAELGRLMDENHRHLQIIGVSTDALERLVRAARKAGALGAKLSGSGGGGIMIALAPPGQQTTIAAAIAAAGGTSLVVSAGASGVRDEVLDDWPGPWESEPGSDDAPGGRTTRYQDMEDRP